ncbi:MAG: efflux transporter outer membrane subunit [Magnetospirillum sp.]|nr:efflux transporter outer membrane subunit [Magnetospirillum sp.]
MIRPTAPFRRGLLAAAGLSVLAGCAVGPDFERPAAPKAKGYTAESQSAPTAAADVAGGKAQRFVEGKDIPAEWWTLFHSQALNTLIEQALKANPGIEAAQAALRMARENVYAQEGAYFPAVSAGAGASREKDATGTLTPVTNSGSPIYNLYTGQVAVSYTPDVFGGNRRQVESLAAQEESQRFQLEATRLTLSSNVAAAAVQEASLRGQIAATEKIVAIETELLDVLRRQYALGQIAGADVVAQEAALAQAEQTLPPLRKQLALQRDALAALCGRLPSDEPSQHFELASLQLPQDLPLSLPSKLVEQRPDVRAAEANLHSASAQIGVAIANRLPNIALTADIGTTASEIGQTFFPGNGFWGIAAGLTQPVFQGGTLLHRQRAAEAAFDQAAAQYRGAVIAAFQNVADTLRALRSDADTLKAALATQRAASESLDIARRQLELGQVGYLSVLNAQQTELQAEIALVQAQAGRFADTTALFQALGGGWWNRPQHESDGG